MLDYNTKQWNFSKKSNRKLQSYALLSQHTVYDLSIDKRTYDYYKLDSNNKVYLGPIRSKVAQHCVR